MSDSGNVHTKRWVSALKKHGIEVLLFSLRDIDRDFYNNIGVTLVSPSKSLKGSVISKLRYLLSISLLNKTIKDFNPDLINAHYASSYGLLAALGRRKCPLITSMWGTDVYDFPNSAPFGKQIMKFNLKRADAVFSTSHVMDKETNKYTDKKIKITPFGVDTKLFKPLGNSIDHFTVGIVKTMQPVYGIDVLIKAFKLVMEANPNLRTSLEIYGRGECLEEYRELSKDLGIEEYVNFRGFVENNQLPAVYNSFSVAVSPSYSESFGVVAVEAMSCGCPVITSDADGFTEVVEDGVTGFIVPKGNPKAIAEAIQKFIDNPGLRETMGRAGRSRVIELYKWDNNVDTMISYYRTVIESARKSVPENI